MKTGMPRIVFLQTCMLNCFDFLLTLLPRGLRVDYQCTNRRFLTCRLCAAIWHATAPLEPCGPSCQLLRFTEVTCAQRSVMVQPDRSRRRSSLFLPDTFPSRKCWNDTLWLCQMTVLSFRATLMNRELCVVARNRRDLRARRLGSLRFTDFPNVGDERSKVLSSRMAKVQPQTLLGTTRHCLSGNRFSKSFVPGDSPCCRLVRWAASLFVLVLLARGLQVVCHCTNWLFSFRTTHLDGEFCVVACSARDLPAWRLRSLQFSTPRDAQFPNVAAEDGPCFCLPHSCLQEIPMRGPSNYWNDKLWNWLPRADPARLEMANCGNVERRIVLFGSLSWAVNSVFVACDARERFAGRRHTQKM